MVQVKSENISIPYITMSKCKYTFLNNLYSYWHMNTQIAICMEDKSNKYDTVLFTLSNKVMNTATTVPLHPVPVFLDSFCSHMMYLVHLYRDPLSHIMSPSSLVLLSWLQNYCLSWAWIICVQIVQHQSNLLIYVFQPS